MDRQLTQPDDDQARSRERSGPGCGSADPALDELHAVPADAPALLLHSGRPDPRWASRSIRATPAAWFRCIARPDGTCQTQLLTADAATPHPLADQLTGHLWRDLRTILHHDALPGRWFGYLSYDLARVIEHRKLTQSRHHDWPLVELAWCPDTIEFPARTPFTKAATTRFSDSCVPTPVATNLRSNFTRDAYLAAVQRVLDYIAAGDVFQVNLAQRFTANFTGDPRRLYQRLASISPAWYGAYMELGTRNAERGSERALLSTSPELFLQLNDRHVITRPIKGTRPAGATRFSESHDELLRSPKDTAELNMIVDLMRNDLGRVCAYGSVRVDEARVIESHPTVHHGVATISGDLHASRDVVDLLRATLPGGSVTGAPKVRAMQIIDELEPDPRGPYCGCIGYLSKDDACLNIAIRTMLISDFGSRIADVHGDAEPNPKSEIRNPKSLSFSVGGGIVADSDPAAEYDETLTKARAMLDALGVGYESEAR
ncbi:MAG: aminodeoxychorismate synthase, component I [Phycisphaera sp.]|nr:aminodeoxychorismate synthase, component I [Phycisphaera sp.]